MDKKTAFELAKRFKKDLPHLADRPVRYTDTPTSGYNAFTTWYRIAVGPRGGMGKSHRITTSTPGSTVIFGMKSGEVLLRADCRGWKSYHSSVVMPYDECGDYAGNQWQPTFTTEEKLEAVRWAIANGAEDDDGPSYLADVLFSLIERQEFENAPEPEWEMA
jgi:hypothetical protein